MTYNLGFDKYLLLLQPVSGWTADALVRFTSLVSCRRLKAEVLPSPAAYFAVNLFAR